jgi:hypothetical protein
MTQSTGKMIITMAWFISRMRLVFSLKYIFCEENLRSIPFSMRSFHKLHTVSAYMGDHVLQSAGYIFKTAEWISIKVVVGNSY